MWLGWVVVVCRCCEEEVQLLCCCCACYAVDVLCSVLLLCLVGEEEGGEGVWMWLGWVVVVLVCLVHTSHPWASRRRVRLGLGRSSNPCRWYRRGVFGFHCQLGINTTSLNYKFNIILVVRNWLERTHINLYQMILRPDKTMSLYYKFSPNKTTKTTSLYLETMSLWYKFSNSNLGFVPRNW